MDYRNGQEQDKNIHLGRSAAALRELLPALDIDPNPLLPHHGWHLAVNEAVRLEARAVLLAGDVISFQVIPS